MHAQHRQRLERRGHATRIALLVVVRAALHIGDARAFLLADHQTSVMSGDAHLRKTRQVRVGNGDCILEGIDHVAEASSQHDGDLNRIEAGSLVDDVGGRC